MILQRSMYVRLLKNEWSPEAINTFRDRISEMAKSNYFGFDINPDLVKATKMNMVMNNDGSGNILQSNSLLPPHEWTDDFRSNLAEALGIDKASIRNYKTIEFFIVDAIIDHLNKHAEEVITVDDNRISKNIILPGRFKRVYVGEGEGRVFIGGKQLHELDPSNKKYLSLSQHGERIEKQLELHENMTLITCSGTIGKVALVGRHWEKWAANQHIIRIVPASENIAGYLNIFLASEYGYHLITRYTYGAVIDEIDATHVSNIPIPLLKNHDIQKRINDLALEANQKRYEAYKLEQKALEIMDREVIYAK